MIRQYLFLDRTDIIRILRIGRIPKLIFHTHRAHTSLCKFCIVLHYNNLIKFPFLILYKRFFERLLIEKTKGRTGSTANNYNTAEIGQN